MNWNKIVEAGRLYGESKRKPKRKKRRAANFVARTAAKSETARNAAKARKEGFYDSREWKRLRYQVLKLNDGRCELCGSSRNDGVKLHVDHIKPRSKYPALELEISNLQVLCDDCNLGKGNKCTRDWRGPTAADLKTVGDP